MTGRAAARNRIASIGALFGIAAALILTAGPAHAQAIIKVSDNVNIKLGLLLQPSVEWIQIADPAHPDQILGYQQNLFIRRARILVGGQVAKDVFFFAETENSTLGKSTTVPPAANNKSLATGFGILDATAEWRLQKEFNLQVGLIRVPTSREALKASGSEVELDFSAWTFLQSTPTQSVAGRDTGAMVRGYFLNDHLEYRVAGFQGFRVAGSRNSLRFTSRLQYNFFDTELYNMPSYAASYLGAKKILNIGGAADIQDEYKSFAFDGYASIPIPSGSIDGSLAFQSIDGGAFLTTLPKQQTYQAELLYYAKGVSLAPWIRWERRDFTNAAVDVTTGDNRYSVGLTYLVSKTNVMIKSAYTRLNPKTGPTSNRPATNQFGVMLHVAYF